MAGIKETVAALLRLEERMTGAKGKVANFAYTDKAYQDNNIEGATEYAYKNEQNIPLGTTAGTDSNITTLTKGFRTMGSSIARMLMNHFLGRCSYNINKMHDWFKEFLTSFASSLKGSILLWDTETTYSAGEFCFTFENNIYRIYKAKKENTGNQPPKESSNDFWDILSSHNATSLGTLKAATWETQVQGIKVDKADDSTSLGTLKATTWETQVNEKIEAGTAASAVMLENEAVIETVGPNGTAVMNRNAVKTSVNAMYQYTASSKTLNIVPIK